MQQSLSKNLNEQTERRPAEREIELLMPVEFNDGEPIGNMYRERLADPVTRGMDYTKHCILNNGQGIDKDPQVSRKECKRAELLRYVYDQYREKDPEGFRKGLPGKDLMMFMGFPVECRTCILYRFSPRSPENVIKAEMDAQEHRKADRSNLAWSLAGGAMAGVWTIGLTKDYLALVESYSVIAGLALGAATFILIRSRRPELPTDAHGQAEGRPSFLGLLRSRVTRLTRGHGSTRYREVEDGIPSSPSTPAGASNESASEQAPTTATAPPTTSGGNPAPTPEPVKAPPAPAMKGPGPNNTVTVKPAQYATADPPVKQSEPRKGAVTSPVEGAEAKTPGIPPKPSRQPSKKGASKGRAKKAEVKEPPKEPELPPAPVAEGFPCDHPGCGKVCKTLGALNSHKRIHNKAGAEPRASKN